MLVKQLGLKILNTVLEVWKRPKNIGLSLVKYGLFALGFIFGGREILSLIIRVFLGTVPESYLDIQNRIFAFDAWFFAICIIVIISGILTIYFDRKSQNRTYIILIEAKGLRDDDGTTLEKAVLSHYKGNIVRILLDLRNRMDGKVLGMQQALDDIAATHRSLLQHKSDLDRGKITTVYGGLTPVPYTFLTGIMLDDEGKVITYDWDRSIEAWRRLDELDDEKLFIFEEKFLPEEKPDIVVAISFSYPIDLQDIKSTFNNYPILMITLDGLSSDSHWSQSKQNRLAQEFLEVVKKLSQKGVNRIHLLMAAPNSTVFTFGRRYDKRNLPEIIVYQFEKGNSPTYPWGVRMPVSGVNSAEIIRTDLQEDNKNNQ